MKPARGWSRRRLVLNVCAVEGRRVAHFRRWERSGGVPWQLYHSALNEMVVIWL